jgi:hypothetical protein
MRGRPVRELLRRFTLPIAAAAALAVVPVAAAGGGPSPDRAPDAPATLAPDPVPGTSQAPPAVTRPVTTVPAAAPSSVAVAPVVTHAAPKPKPVKHAAAVHRAHKQVPVKKSEPPVRFVLPRVAAPSLAAIAAAPSHDGEVALAGLALLLAAVTAGSGARLVAVWSRRA